MVVPEDTFPEEIWLLVLSQLTNRPDDLFNCIHTYVMWNRLLLSSRTEWMFPLIVRFLMKHLQLQDLLACRVVSKMWRKSIDKLLVPDEHYEKWLVEELVKDKHISEMPPFVHLPRFYSHHLEIFNLTFKECPLPKSFHLFRTVQLTVDIYKEGTPLLSFLKIFGQSIRELQLEIRIGVPAGERDWYNWLKMKTHPPTTILLHILKVLQFVQNLNYLRVVATSDKILTGSEEESSHFLENYTSPPLLPKLQILDLETKSEQIKSVLLKLYASNSNLLNGVTVFQPNDSFSWISSGRRDLCRTVKHYTIPYLYRGNFYKEIDYFTKTIHYPLESINLQFWASIPNVFHMLSPILKFKSTLRKLTLSIFKLPMLPKKLIMKLPFVPKHQCKEINQVLSEYLMQLTELTCLQLRIAQYNCLYTGEWVGKPLKYFLWTSSSSLGEDVNKLSDQLFSLIWPRFKNCAKSSRKVSVSTSPHGTRLYITATVV